MEVATDDREVAAAIGMAMAELIGPRRYELWFGPNTRLSLADGRLRVWTANRFYQDWLRDHFRANIESACRKVLGHVPQVTFHIDAALAAARPHSTEVARSKSSAPAAHAATSESPTQKPSGSQSAASARRPWATLEQFVVGPGSQVARDACQRAIERPGETSPLVIHGPTSVGKTHLLEAICNAHRRAHPNRPAVLVTAEQFTSGFLGALHGSGLPSFRRKFRGVELLAIDDLQFFAGKRATLIELHSTIDVLAREGKQLVLAADRPPERLPELGRDLITRLEGGLVCGIAPPDFETRLEIVRRLGASLGVAAPHEVWRYVAGRVMTHARALRGAVLRLDAYSRAHQMPIDLALAAAALADIVPPVQRQLRLPQIEAAVCETLGLEASALHAGGKTRQINAARMLAMWLARKHTGAALSEIGKYFGRRSHSTVVAAEKKIRGLLAQGAELRVAGHTCTLDDAVRRIEARLKAS